MKLISSIALMLAGVSASAQGPQAHVTGGVVEGTARDGVEIFKGIPFAAPPVGDLRWRAPQPVAGWEGVRQAKEYSAFPMQLPVFGDIDFGASGVSEDCLYLNVWTPEDKGDGKLPVLLYFNGGALIVGSGNEPRYSGESLAKKGVIVVTPNYREGIFGFFSHPGLSAESAYGGSGNYGFMDMLAAIDWVRDNIPQFGGDPERITIAGESAGSISVSTLMASPLSRGKFAQAIGSSGSTLGHQGLPGMAQAEQMGVEKAAAMGCADLGELRALPAEELLNRSQSFGMMAYPVDGYVLTGQPLDVYARGEQVHVPLLVGGNSHEMAPAFILWGQAPTVENLRRSLQAQFGDSTDRVLGLYGIESDGDVSGQPGVDLASDMFLGFTTRKWAESHAATGGNPVYLYNFTHSRPWKKGEAERTPEAIGAVHAADIEYAMGTLDTNTVYDWQADDYAISDIFSDFYVNFVKTGNPDPAGTYNWTPVNGEEVVPVLQLDVQPQVKRDKQLQERYDYMDRLLLKK